MPQLKAFFYYISRPNKVSNATIKILKERNWPIVNSYSMDEYALNYILH